MSRQLDGQRRERDFHDAIHALDWPRAEQLALAALQEADLSEAERDAWRARRAAAAERLPAVALPVAAEQPDLLARRRRGAGPGPPATMPSPTPHRRPSGPACEINFRLSARGTDFAAGDRTYTLSISRRGWFGWLTLVDMSCKAVIWSKHESDGQPLSSLQ